MTLRALLLALAALPGLSQYYGGIPECGEGTYHEIRMPKCQERLEAYEADWSDFRVNLEVTCEDVEDPQKLEGLGDCRRLIAGGGAQSAGWTGIGYFNRVDFRDDGGKYQASEWSVDGVPTQYGWRDYSWPSKLTADGKGCLETDGYCRARRRCTVVGRMRGLVRPIGGRNKAHDWNTGSDIKDWWNLRVKDSARYLNRVARCVSCQVVPCPSFVCPNGRVVGFPAQTVAGSVVKRPSCDRPCGAGTFLTCRRGSECSYQPLTEEDARRDRESRLSGSKKWYRENLQVLKSEVNLINVEKAGPPVEQCYPCRLAAGLTHYDEAASTDDALMDQGFLRFYCPGGAEAPVRCGTNQVTKIDAATGGTSACGCQGGYYYNGTLGRCALCEAGFFCDWKGASPPVPEECPADEYSALGSRACTPCDMEARCEAGKALTRCRKSQGREAKGQFQKKNSYCVQCLECQQLGGDKPCYKVTPLIASVPT